jgi:hypothetical protein
MGRMIRTGVLAVGLLAGFGLHAQSEEDALRISTLMPGGTARSNGMANAYGAVGADAAAIGINPAGFGLYRISELSFTPSIEVNDAASTFYRTKASDTQTRFHFNNMALVLNAPGSSGGDWRSSTYGVVYDRQQSHHWRKQAKGMNVPSTILERFVNEANGTSITDLNNDAFPFSSSLAWYTYGINDIYPVGPDGDTIPNQYASAIPFGSLTDQLHTVESRGASTKTSFFYSGNYLDKLYLGVSIGIAGHRFRRNTEHTETTVDTDLDLREVTYREELTTTGNGVDVKVGVLGRATERLRIGAAFHSPQWMQLNDAFFYVMDTRFRTPDSDGRYDYSAASPDGVFSYNVHTPWKVTASAAYIAGANGLMSVDYEYTDYRRMRFRPSNRLTDDYDFMIENDLIKRSFRAVHSVRVGTEWRMGNWYYRLGWGFVPDAYVESDPRHGQALKVYAAGIGYRTDNVGVELGLNYTQQQVNTFPYPPDPVAPVREDLSTYRSFVTVSFRP